MGGYAMPAAEAGLGTAAYLELSDVSGRFLGYFNLFYLTAQIADPPIETSEISGSDSDMKFRLNVSE